MYKKEAKVYFIGAGPGEPELLTIKAAKILSEAEVVITDRLVSEEILTQHVNPVAHIIPVGKQGGSSASKLQKEINQLLLNAAERFSVVVRLKGGDTSLFSNIFDELTAVKNAGIQYEIIPGITAASGAAAYAGIPLTARGFASSVRMLTCFDDEIISDAEWNALATTRDTLILYMSANKMLQVACKLMNAGASPQTSLLVIEQATTPNQYVHRFQLSDFIFNDNSHFISPSIVIIGNITALQEKFEWLQNGERQPYFTQLKNTEQPIKL